MAAIHEKLKALRQDSGLTQAEVAERLGTVRQTVSSYESGRTQPDLETLKKLTGIYEISIETLLSDTKRKTCSRGIVKWTARLVAVAFFLCNAVHSALLWTANHYFEAPEGQVSQEMKEALRVRVTLSNTAEWVERILLIGVPLLCMILLVQLALVERPVPAKQRWMYLGILAGAAMITTAPWAVADPVFGWWNYGFPAVAVLTRSLILLVISAPIERFLRKRT